MENKTISRRNLLRTSGLAGTALFLGIYFPANAKNARLVSAVGADQSGFELNARVHIDTNGKVTIFSHRAEMGQVFQGRSPRQLALQLLEPKQNGGKTKAQLINHMANDPLVGWGWHPGDGRTLPPMTRPAFVAQARLWIAKGAYAPGEK